MGSIDRKYLDYDGLQLYDAKIKSLIENNSDSDRIYITEDATNSQYAKVYNFFQGGVTQEFHKGTINIPKDLMVREGKLVVVSEAEKGIDGYPTVAGTYIRLILNTADKDDEQAPIWIPVTDLVDVYTVEENADEVQLHINSDNVISAMLTSEVKEEIRDSALEYIKSISPQDIEALFEGDSSF